MNNKMFFSMVLTGCMLLAGVCQADAESLNVTQVERLKAVHLLLADVDSKSFSQMKAELERSQDSSMQLDIKEAMARAYADIVREQQVKGKGKKQWLYSMVALNMAYFQFGGSKDSAAGATNLNKLIRQKLKTYLPAGIFKRPGFHTSVE